MPMYEYQCDACGARFEQIQKFSDPPVEVCPTCGERKVRKLLSSPAIQFKGSGWYITDYARKSSGDGKGSGSKADSKTSESSTAESSTTSDSSSASSTKSETKSDTKSDPKTT
jgi:putative FmdB family regulatory protein